MKRNICTLIVWSASHSLSQKADTTYGPKERVILHLRQTVRLARPRPTERRVRNLNAPNVAEQIKAETVLLPKHPVARSRVKESHKKIGNDSRAGYGHSSLSEYNSNTPNRFRRHVRMLSHPSSSLTLKETPATIPNSAASNTYNDCVRMRG